VGERERVEGGRGRGRERSEGVGGEFGLAWACGLAMQPRVIIAAGIIKYIR
jgi:hypothetical protein